MVEETFKRQIKFKKKLECQGIFILLIKTASGHYVHKFKHCSQITTLNLLQSLHSKFYTQKQLYPYSFKQNLTITYFRMMPQKTTFFHVQTQLGRKL